MVKVEKDKIGLREIFSILVFMISTKATDITVTQLIERTFNSAWMVIIGSFIMILPSLIALNLVLKKYQTKNLLEVTQITLGRPIAFLLGLILFFILLFGTAVESRSYTDQLITMNFPKTPLFILYMIFLFICLFGAKKGWEALGSVAWMVFPYITLAVTLLFVLLMKDSVLNRIFPIFGTGKWEVVKASFQSISIYGDAVIIAMMYPFVKDHKTFSKGYFGSLIYTVTLMAFMYILYILVFDYRSVGKITYPFSEATRLVNIGRVITNIETFFLTFWLLAVIVKFAVYIYLVCSVFGFVFKIKEFEHTIIPITILILLIGMYPANVMENTFLYKHQLMTYTKYYFLSLPLMLFLVVKWKEARNR
nr:endospore germination permease [Neobacillus sp. Marseille-Q6967]